MLKTSKLVATGVISLWALTAVQPAFAASSTPKPTPSASPSGQSGSDTAGRQVVTFGLGPSSHHKADSRANFNMLAPKGQSLSDEVAVVNVSYQPLTLNLYAADGLNAADGSLTLQPGYVQPKDAAAWVTFGGRGSKGYVVLAPRETVIVPFVVHVPKNAYVGDHLAGIVASLVTAGTEPGKRSTNIKFEQRVGIRLGVRVAGVLKPGLQIGDVQATYSGTLNPFGKGVATISYRVTNTGNVRLGGQQEVNVHGLVGPIASAGTLANVPMLLPGNSAQVSVAVPDISPMGLETADISVSGLSVAGDADPPVEIATASASFWAVPWTLLAGLLGLSLLSLGLVRMRRSRSLAPGASVDLGNSSNVSDVPAMVSK